MKKNALLLALIILCSKISAQNIFPVKLDNCVTARFCLDCGDEPGSVDSVKFNAMITDLNQKNNYRGLRGKVLFQVLIDSTGHGCVLSHTDVSKSTTVKNIVDHFNAFDGWIPAKVKGKIEGMVSINVSATIKDGILSSRIERVDQKAFMKSFDHPRDPEIYNKDYVYKNEHLKDYRIQVWNSSNSKLPDNFNNDIAIGAQNHVFITTENGIAEFDGKDIKPLTYDGIDKKFNSFNCIGTNNKGILWASGGDDIYSYDGKWTTYNKSTTGLSGAFHIINNKRSNEVFFCSDSGLTILKDGKWQTLNKSKINQLPSNRVCFAKRDSKNRLWIGTFSGSVLIDEKGNATGFEETNTVLKGQCITAVDEDESGNIYLGLFEFDRPDKKQINNNEGFAIYTLKGDIKQFTTANSGMPFNHTTTLLYDRKEKVLWIATDRAGLVRYDLKDTWENYNNKNSDIPTSYISDMEFDNNGILYLSTRQGLVKIEKNNDQN